MDPQLLQISLSPFTISGHLTAAAGPLVLQPTNPSHGYTWSQQTTSGLSSLGSSGPCNMLSALHKQPPQHPPPANISFTTAHLMQSFHLDDLCYTGYSYNSSFVGSSQDLVGFQGVKHSHENTHNAHTCSGPSSGPYPNTTDQAMAEKWLRM